MTALLILLVPWIMHAMASGFGQAKLVLTCRLSYLLLPSILLTGVVTIWSAVLNAGQRFVLVALAPMAVPLVSAGALVFAPPGTAAYALSIGFIGGILLQALLVGCGLRRQNVALSPHWGGHDPALRAVLGQYLPLIASAVLMNGTAFVDQIMAARLEPGTISVISYGNKLVLLFLNVISMSLGTAVLPYFSRWVAAADWVSVQRTLKHQVLVILLITLPVMALILLRSEDIIRLFFRRGSFSEVDVRAVGGVQAMYALQIPFYTLCILFARLVSAMAMNRVLMYGTMISFLLNITLDIVLMRFIGARGIALSTSIVYAISFAYLVCYSTIAVRRRAGWCACPW